MECCFYGKAPQGNVQKERLNSLELQRVIKRLRLGGRDIVSRDSPEKFWQQNIGYDQKQKQDTITDHEALNHTAQRHKESNPSNFGSLQSDIHDQDSTTTAMHTQQE